ncbi:hypothetical protein Tco_1063625 [Tanacetum coccineum]
MSGNEDHHRQGRRFAARGNRHDERDPRDVEIERLRNTGRVNLEINPFRVRETRAPLQRHRRPSPAPPKTDLIRSLGIRTEIPEFEGRLCPDDFLDWLRTVDRIFDLRDTPDHIKVSGFAPFAHLYQDDPDFKELWDKCHVVFFDVFVRRVGFLFKGQSFMVLPVLLRGRLLYLSAPGAALAGQFWNCGVNLINGNCLNCTYGDGNWNLPTSSYDDDDDEYSFATHEYLMTCSTAIIPDSPKTDSLVMVDKHLDTILETKSDEFIKSSVENLVQNTSKSEDEWECDVPDCDDSQTTNFSTFSNPLFDDSTSSDDESSHEEAIHEISFKTYSNPLFDLDEVTISSEFNPILNEDLDSTPKNDRFDTESYLLESLLKHDTLMASSPKIDSLFDEFSGELITIPLRIVREHEEYISLIERLLYDNSSPRPPEDFHAIPDTIIESLPTFSIPVEDNDSLREEIDIFLAPDDSIPPGIESDDFDSECDDNSTYHPEFESFHVDYPDSGDSTINVVEDIPVDVPNILPTHPTLHMDFDFIPSHNDLGSDLDVSSPSGDRNKIYDPGICIKVESTRFLATLSPVIDTLLLFSSENKD